MLATARVSAVLVLLSLAVPARAATTSFTFLIDSDANSATGCSASVPGGTLAGVELRLTVPVTTNTTAGTVGALSVQTCAGGVFGSASPVDVGGWPVGVGLGTSASDVIEAYVPLSFLASSSSARITVVSSADAIGPGTVVLGGTPAPANIPTLSPLAMVLLAIGLALFGLRFLRPPSGAGVLFLVVLAGGGIAWAAINAHDGNPSDWAGVPSLATDLSGDSAAGADLIALFARADTGNLEIRVDARLAFDVPPAPTGVLLEGAAGSPAVEATTDLIFRDGVPPGEIGVDADGLEVARTMIEIAFQVDATVGDVNAMLQSVNARIVSMLDGVAIVTVRIPDPGSLAGLDAVVAQVEVSPVVRHVNRAYFYLADELPPNYTPSSTDLVKIDHNLAIRAHAAWNARAALSGASASFPLVIVGDRFGNGAPASDFDVNDNNGDYGQTNPNEHGYHVLGIISATFGDGLTPGNLATGIFPATALSRAVDMNFTFQSPAPTTENRIIDMIKGSPSARIVLNTSFGNDCRTAAAVAALCSTSSASRQALDWIEKVRGSTAAGPNVEGKFVHASSAGNVNVAGDINAALSSRFNASRLLQSLTGPGGASVTNLSNVLVVENRRNSTTTPFQPGCLNSGSKVLGNISAIGTDVWSLDTALGDLFASNKSGTSMASPQVAGLSAYVWALDPSLSNAGVIDVLKKTARSLAGDTGCSVAPSQVVDAYAAVLAADRGFLQSPARRAILDAADSSGSAGTNLQFDEKDVELFLSSFDAAAGAIDYSRFDLNGDGRTGGTATDSFDLDINRPVILGNVTQSIEGSTAGFNESAVTDLDVLCYYAYSSIFTAVDPAERGRLLGARCVPSVTVSPASVTLAPGATRQFTATVTGTANEAVVWSATGGSITSTGLYTAPSGNGQHTVTARSVEVPAATGTATVVVGTPTACTAPAYGLAGNVTRVENFGSGGFSRTSQASAFVTLCFSPSGSGVTVQQVTGTSAQHLSEPDRTVDCSGVFGVRFPHPTQPGQFIESRYSDPRFNTAGVMTQANLFGAVQGTCTATEGTSSFTNVQPLGQGTHTIQNGRIVEIVFDSTGSEVTTTGRLLPVPP